MANIINSFASWINSLLGRSKMDVKKMEEAVNKAPSQEKGPQSEYKGEDSVAADFFKFKEFLSALFSKVGQKVPKTTSKSLRIPSGILKFLIFLLIVIVLILVAVNLFKKAKENGGETPFFSQETPTPGTFNPIKPSVYTDDPEVLELEEEINVIEKELTAVNIKEERLGIPLLDFKVDF